MAINSGWPPKNESLNLAIVATIKNFCIDGNRMESDKLIG